MAALQKNHEHIVLVGMPGVGKTTVGKALAEATGRPFVDLDDELAKDIGSIPDFIQTHGEPAFRREESKVVERFGKQSGLIISTGGGAVTVPANFAPLRQNGRIYQITQPVDKLATNGRPLSSGGLDRLKELERIRKPMYEAFAQCIIEHHKNAPQTVEKILNDFYANLGR
ncbi:MAG: AAA family ATPase [Veillonella sp.]|nr:AAA family ATPase [Veillonella sp.]